MLTQILALYAEATTDRRGEDGQSMVEYGVMVALVAVAAMVAVQALGTGIGGVFMRIVGRIASIG